MCPIIERDERARPTQRSGGESKETQGLSGGRLGYGCRWRREIGREPGVSGGRPVCEEEFE
ncbi:hypothetical protein SLEP1_g40857 [Rubroshorea leprosula]|uniref:Uncharacterized protein n=1 Tax=Rubroshorea leprosula TaxID=152421 RepID=A0AAV5L4X1_9ROSI|nr:hypothetical protein SLEP1_g40857 [Rubroshorea leprosula]